MEIYWNSFPTKYQLCGAFTYTTYDNMKRVEDKMKPKII